MLANEKFQECLGYYKPYIGINDYKEVEHWAPLIAEKQEAEKAKAEEEAKVAAEA